MTKFVCVSVPYYVGEIKGSAKSSAVLQQRGIAGEIGADWIEIQPQFGDEPRISSINRALAEVIAAQDSQTVALVLAGDCTACLGAMKGLEKYNPDVLWYDAHGDFNTNVTTPSGFLGGMPLAAMVGRDNQHWLQAIGLDPLDEAKVFVTDVRDLDPEEGELLRASAVTILPTVDAVQRLAWNKRPLYIHFDTDVLHLDALPAVSYPAQGGPSLSEAIDSARHVIGQANVKAILFSLWNNDLDGAEHSADSTLALVRAMVEELRN